MDNNRYDEQQKRWQEDPIKAEKRAEDYAQEQQLKTKAQGQKTYNDTREAAADGVNGGDWQNKGSDKAEQTKLGAQAKGKEVTNDLKDFGDKVGDTFKEGADKVKDFFHRDDRVE